MGLVTSIAGHTAGVLSSHDLGKSGGFGGIFLMAAAAEGGDIGQLRLDGRGIIGMLSVRTVAGFAGYAGMLAGSPNLGLIGVAKDAGVLSGVGEGMGAHHRQSPGPIVAVLAKRLRNDSATDEQEDAKTGQ
jgi:hypothetical protein